MSDPLRGIVWKKYPYGRYRDTFGTFSSDPRVIPVRIPIPTHLPKPTELAHVEGLGLDPRQPNWEQLKGLLLKLGLRANDLAALSVEAILALLSQEKKTPAGDGAGADPDQAGADTKPQWLTVTDAAKASGCNRGEISRAADNGSLKSNGEKGRQRRIDAADLALWQVRRAKRKEPVESNATVERKLKRARGE